MIFSGNYRYFRLPWVIRMLIFKKENQNHELKTILKQDVQNYVTSLNTKNVHLPFKQLVTREWCNPPNLSFRANGHTKIKVQFSSRPQITRWSVHKYIHNVTKVMYALSALQKEWRKVWGARYTLGARYRSENTVNTIHETFTSSMSSNADI